MTIQGVLIEVSPSVTNILGYVPEELIGKEITQYVNSVSIEKIKDEISYKIANPLELSRYELPIQASDGREVICDINTRLVKELGISPRSSGLSEIPLKDERWKIASGPVSKNTVIYMKMQLKGYFRPQ